MRSTRDTPARSPPRGAEEHLAEFRRKQLKVLLCVHHRICMRKRRRCRDAAERLLGSTARSAIKRLARGADSSDSFNALFDSLREFDRVCQSVSRVFVISPFLSFGDLLEWTSPRVHAEEYEGADSAIPADLKPMAGTPARGSHPGRGASVVNVDAMRRRPLTRQINKDWALICCCEILHRGPRVNHCCSERGLRGLF